MLVPEKKTLQKAVIIAIKPPKATKFVRLIILPALLIFVFGILVPIVIGFYISFTDSSARTGFFGKPNSIINYYDLISFNGRDAPLFWRYTYQTIFFAVISLIMEFLLSLLFAHILNKSFRGRGLARATLLIPWAIPTVASATIFRSEIFAPAEIFGLVNNILKLFSLNPIYFYGSDAMVLFNLPALYPVAPYVMQIPITTTMLLVIIIDVWKTTPFLTLLFLADLQLVDQDLYKAAEIDGASTWQKFRHITMPNILPALGIALIFRAMDAIRVYDAVVVFNDDSVKSMTSLAVDIWLTRQQYGLSSAVAILTFAFIILFAFVILRFTRQRERKLKMIPPGMAFPVEKRNQTQILQTEKIPVLKILHKDQKDTDIIIEPVKISITQKDIKWFKRKRRIMSILFVVAVLIMCLWCAGPFIWIVIRSFRDPYIPQTHFELFPEYLSFGSYQLVFANSQFYGNFAQALLNGFLLSGMTALVVIGAGCLIAYALAKFEFSLKRYLTLLTFAMTSLPPLIIIIPLFIQTKLIGNLIPFLDLTDNILGLVLPYAAINMPLAIFVLRAFFADIPKELWSAATVDGASHFQIFRKIILPLTVPGIFTVAILAFIASWNELLLAQIWLISSGSQTVPRTILRFLQNTLSLQATWNTNLVLMAAITIATLPLVIMVLIFQRQIIKGITSGAIKG